MARDGHIYKRGNIYWIKYYRAGKPYYESTKSDKETDARRLLRKRLGQIADGAFLGLSPEKVRIDELASDLLNDYRINEKKSLADVVRRVRCLLAHFRGMRAHEITTDRVRSYILHRQQARAKNSTINRELAALKRMFNLALQQTPPKVVRKPYISMLEEHNIRTGFFEYGEFLVLRDALPEYLRPLASFAYYTGWRKQEILRLQWWQVDLPRGAVRLEPGTTKNDDGRVVFMDGELLEILLRQKELRDQRFPDCPWVFFRDGRRIGDFRKAWRTACQRAGLAGKIPHDFRRTAVRDMVRAGVPERVAMQISGHRTRSVFDRYDIVSEADLLAAARRRSAYMQERARQVIASAQKVEGQ